MADATVAVGDAQDPFVLALDVGSSSVRTIVFDGLGRSVQSWEAHEPYAVHTTTDGGVEADADVLVALVVDCVDAATEMVGSAGRKIAAVAADTFWHSLLGVDASGKAVTPVYTWADTRSSQAAANLQQRLNVEEVRARTGVAIHSSYWPAKLLWIQETAPDVCRRVTHWVSVAEYIYLKLFGQLRVSVSMASGTGIFNQNACAWDSRMLETLHVHEDRLSPLADIRDACTQLSAPYDTRWPALHGIPWFLPIGDGAANNIGSGGTTADTVVVMIGTSGALRVVRDVSRVEIPHGIWTYRVDRRRFVQGGALSAGGNVFAWLARSFQIRDIDALERQVAHLPPDGHGLTVLPFLAGERSPDWNVHAQSAIVGLTLDTTPVEIIRALLEAMTYRFGLVYGLLCMELPSVRAIIGSGAGLLSSPVWLQMMSDVLGQPIAASAVVEATSRGSALLALECLGAIPDITVAPVSTGRTYTPDSHNTEIYRAAMKRQDDLYQKLLT